MYFKYFLLVIFCLIATQASTEVSIRRFNQAKDMNKVEEFLKSFPEMDHHESNSIHKNPYKPKFTCDSCGLLSWYMSYFQYHDCKAFLGRVDDEIRGFIVIDYNSEHPAVDPNKKQAEVIFMIHPSVVDSSYDEIAFNLLKRAVDDEKNAHELKWIEGSGISDKLLESIFQYSGFSRNGEYASRPVYSLRLKKHR